MRKVVYYVIRCVQNQSSKNGYVVEVDFLTPILLCKLSEEDDKYLFLQPPNKFKQTTNGHGIADISKNGSG